jgi:hypothetical protein
MNLKDVRNLDKDELLGLLGLERKASPAAGLAAALGTFGVGLLVGAGIALILAPKPGHELRQEIRDRLRRSPQASEGDGDGDGKDEIKAESATAGGAKAAADPQA